MFRVETRHALRVAAAMARREERTVVSDLAAESGVPAPTLSQILHRMSRKGLAVGQPGRGGGYRLARPPEQIRLKEIVAVTEGSDFGLTCLFGLPACSGDQPCPLHHYWAEIRDRLFHLLNVHTVADLAAGPIPLLPFPGSEGRESARAASSPPKRPAKRERPAERRRQESLTGSTRKHASARR